MDLRSKCIVNSVKEVRKMEISDEPMKEKTKNGRYFQATCYKEDEEDML